MKIAPGNITEVDWQGLSLATSTSPDWPKAILIFQRRIQERFIEPVDALIGAERVLRRSDRKYGFAILAIDCLLIETLQAFRYGEINTEGKARKFITDFLCTSQYFKWRRKVSNQFYEDFRCGILHQAETMRDSLVRSEGPLLIAEPTGLIVNRTEFHERLKNAFAVYINELNDPGQSALRANFRTKMNSICRSNTLAIKYPT